MLLVSIADAKEMTRRLAREEATVSAVSGCHRLRPAFVFNGLRSLPWATTSMTINSVLAVRSHNRFTKPGEPGRRVDRPYLRHRPQSLQPTFHRNAHGRRNPDGVDPILVADAVGVSPTSATVCFQ